MNQCEWCGKEFDDKSGKLRFCSHSCRAKYAASKVKNHVCGYAKAKSIKRQTKKDGWKCTWCDKVFRTRKELYNHVKAEHARYDENGKRIVWNKGLTKETCDSIAKGVKTSSDRYKNGEIKVWCAGQQLSDKHRQAISEGMKKAHKEERAHNIGESRWNNEPSYPEQWFMEVIENHFLDKNYIREYPFSKFSLDFAWPHKQKCIEIDGEQHQRFEEVKKRDEMKNKLLAENNWEILRLVWKDVFKEPKPFIEVAKKFIDN